MVRVERIELSASVLSGQRSTTELHTHISLLQQTTLFAGHRHYSKKTCSALLFKEMSCEYNAKARHKVWRAFANCRFRSGSPEGVPQKQ
jgi:hypothetical protein